MPPSLVAASTWEVSWQSQRTVPWHCLNSLRRFPCAESRCLRRIGWLLRSLLCDVLLGPLCFPPWHDMIESIFSLEENTWQQACNQKRTNHCNNNIRIPPSLQLLHPWLGPGKRVGVSNIIDNNGRGGPPVIHGCEWAIPFLAGGVPDFCGACR